MLLVVGWVLKPGRYWGFGSLGVLGFYTVNFARGGLCCWQVLVLGWVFLLFGFTVCWFLNLGVLRVNLCVLSDYGGCGLV